jgi:hypothetical protein
LADVTGGVAQFLVVRRIHTTHIMKDEPISGADKRQEPARTVVTCKIDKDLEDKIVDFLRHSRAPVPAEVLAAHFSQPLKYIEHYLDRLDEQQRARYIRADGKWGWVAVKPEQR